MVKLGDYGLIPMLQQSLELKSIAMHQAPEAFDGKREPKSDVWSLGVLLYELAEGKNPYRLYTALQVMRLVCDGQPPALSSSKWSAEFVDFVNKCLVRDVKERWSVEQLMEVRDWEMVKA